jgi:DUF438 domain-containing protein
MIGTLPENVVKAVLEALPVDISVLDKDDKVLGWNKHATRIFKRPEGVLGKDVRKCHPSKSIMKVETIIAEMKAGKRDVAQFWIDLPLGTTQERQKVLIEYFALRDEKGTYLGCMECSQNIEPHRKLTGEKRLLD